VNGGETIGQWECQPSDASSVTAGPGVGSEFAHVIAVGTSGAVLEYSAEIRPEIEAMPRRAGLDTQQHRGGLQATIATNLQPVGPLAPQWRKDSPNSSSHGAKTRLPG
jgi:hypothetical protein